VNTVLAVGNRNLGRGARGELYTTRSQLENRKTSPGPVVGFARERHLGADAVKK